MDCRPSQADLADSATATTSVFETLQRHDQSVEEDVVHISAVSKHSFWIRNTNRLQVKRRKGSSNAETPPEYYWVDLSEGGEFSCDDSECVFCQERIQLSEACSNNPLQIKGSIHAIPSLSPGDHNIPSQPFLSGILFLTHSERVRARFVKFSDNLPTPRSSSSSLTTTESDCSTLNLRTLCGPRRQRTKSSKTTQNERSEISPTYSSHAKSLREKLSISFCPIRLSAQQSSSSWVSSSKFSSGITSKTLSSPNSVKNSHDFMRMPCRLNRKGSVHNNKTVRPVSTRQEAKCHKERRVRSIRITFWNMASTFGISPPQDKPPSARERIAQAFQNLKEDCGLSCSESSRTQRTMGKSTY